METINKITDIAAHKQSVCESLGCTMEQLNRQYAANLQGLIQMRDKAIRTNKKVNGFTVDQLNEMVNTFTRLTDV